MRRFLTLVSLLCLALPAGISISGCYRNPAAKYCAVTSGYGMKVGDVSSITLEPQTTGISLAYGQTQQISTPQAFDCTRSGVSVSSWTYGTANNQLVDISPSGMICAGTWNRNSGGGISDYTTCNKPATLPSTGGLPYVVINITASANSVTSNPVKVYLHPQVTSITLAGSSLNQQCYSQTTSTQLDSQACYSDDKGNLIQFCAPAGTASYACKTTTGISYPTCSSSLGALSYAVGNSTIGSINSDTNVITALQPGTTSITATIAGSGSSAGYFSVCPPQTLTLKTAAGSTSGTVTQGVTQALTAAATDTNGYTLTGLSLDYQSTNPIDISVSSGSITAAHPGVASIYATCQPSICNPSPLNEFGLYGTGLSSSSNAVTITVPGTTSNYVWFGAPGKSQYFVEINLLTGSAGSTAKLPYVPNSMIMDKTGSSLYFGSTHGLMIASTTNNTVSKTDNSVPGVLLSVSPDNAYALINDQIKGTLYLYNISAGSSSSTGGYAAAAGWTADSKTMYVVDSSSLNTGGVTGHTNTLYVWNTNTGWSTYDISAAGGAWAVAPMVPGIGAYLAGPKTQARAWCPSGTVGSSSATGMSLYPQADIQPIQTDALAATIDGSHILGATQAGSSIQLTDLGITIPTQTVGSVSAPLACACSVPVSSAYPYGIGPCSATAQTLAKLTFTSKSAQTLLNPLGSTAVQQVVTSPVSNLSFITYSAPSTNTGAPSVQLPFYLPTSTKGALGSVGYVSLTGSTVTAPVAGAFSPDNSLFFVSTAGDNLVHFISIPTSVSLTNPPTDTKQIAPALPSCSSTTDDGCTYTGSDAVVPATVITVVPRATT